MAVQQASTNQFLKVAKRIPLKAIDFIDGTADAQLRTQARRAAREERKEASSDGSARTAL